MRMMPLVVAGAPLGVIVAAGGVFGKPPLDDALFLLKEFLDGPQARKGHHADYGAQQYVSNEQGRRRTAHADEQKNPPGACAEIVFRLDHYGMKKTDGQESGDADERAFNIQVFHGNGE